MNPDDQQQPSRSGWSEFAEAVRNGLLIGAVSLVVLIPAWRHWVQPALSPAPHVAAATHPAPKPHVVQRADFGSTPPSDDTRRLADWVADSHDNQGHAFVVVDKREATVYAFDPNAHLIASVPAVLGSAHGDDTYPGVADKPLAQLRPEERTTPAGRFVGELGESSSRGEDVVWVDYDAAVSMHRVIKVRERLEALQTPTPDDNRLSNGCINVPDRFYETVLHPNAQRPGVIFYVLPETRTLQEQFASFYDVNEPANLAQH